MTHWFPLESNPAVLNKFLNEMGVPSEWSLVDVYGLEDDLLAFVPQPVIAMILLFPLTKKAEDLREAQEKNIVESGQELSDDVFFMRQYIGNACGTVALLHALGNNLNKFMLHDGPLKSFMESTKEMTWEERGNFLKSYNGIAEVHDMLAQEGQTVAPERDAKLDTHFIVFVNVGGVLYELDGRKQFPINHGAASDETFLKDAANVCKKFIKSDPEESRFAIMALAISDF